MKDISGPFMGIGAGSPFLLWAGGTNSVMVIRVEP